MTQYHLRHPEQAITDPEGLWAIIREQKYMTLALCKDNEPYLVTVNYAFDQAANCFYFHCAPEGKKIDYLKAHPIVWGQVLEDRGYRDGKCDHAYRTVQFRGKVEFLSDKEEKRRALHLLIDRLESDPEPVKKRLISESRLETVAVGTVQVEEMSGKRGGLTSLE